MNFNINLNNAGGKMVTVSSVIGHNITSGGEYMYHLRFGRNGSAWVNDSDIVGEELIAEYNKKHSIHTTYIVCRVSSKKQSGPTHVSLRSQENRI